ncbi:hypothetical protein AB3S75_017055 [Citrus x aurantiifolia]
MIPSPSVQTRNLSSSLSSSSTNSTSSSGPGGQRIYCSLLPCHYYSTTSPNAHHIYCYSFAALAPHHQNHQAKGMVWIMNLDSEWEAWEAGMTKLGKG